MKPMVEVSHLERSLQALRQVLARPGFGEGAPTVGAELELCIIDRDARPMHVNRELRDAVGDRRVTLEVNRFNLELNSTPSSLAGAPFSALKREFGELMGALDGAGTLMGARTAAIGILPTISELDLQGASMTHTPRYEALSARLRELRGEPFHIRIEGRDTVELQSEAITLEGANTSLQMHLRVAPQHFASCYNAANMALAPLVAVAANSSLFLGCELWDETRIPLFEQSVDVRTGASHGIAARCGFGSDWLRQGAYDLFEEAVRKFEPVLELPVEGDPVIEARSGATPELAALRLHCGTLWRWNRPVFDPRGHLRIEMRALPAGPTLEDMMANAAFAIGLTLHLQRDMPALIDAFNYHQASHNFYEAAREGLDAVLQWPGRNRVENWSAQELVRALVPLAVQGLAEFGVERDEATACCGLILERAESGQTGAQWQRRAVAHYDTAMTRPAALQAMTSDYLAWSATGTPVARWRVGSPKTTAFA